MEEQALRKKLGFFNCLIRRRLKSHNQAAQYPQIPSRFIPVHRKKNSETRNTMHVYVRAATSRIPHYL